MEYSMPVDQGTRNPVSEESQNIAPQYQQVGKCHHPPFPKPSHILLLTTSRDLPPYRPLFVAMYAATPLLNLTCKSFYWCNQLRPQQEVARCEFVQLFLGALAVSKAWYALTNEELEAFEQSRYSRMEVESLARQLEDSLHQMMVRLDDFFFFGALTRYPDKPIGTNIPRYSHVELCTGFGHLRDDFGQTCFADTERVYEAGRWFAKIRLFSKIRYDENLTNRVNRISFEKNVASLIHEMVHAYLQMFVCRSPQCNRNLLNTTGLTGHGPTFMKMFGLIMETVRTWHPSLEYVGQDRCDEGTCFDRVNHDHEQRAIEAYKKTGKHKGYLPLRSDSPKTLIRIVKEDLPNGDCFFHVVYTDPQQRIDPDAEYVDDENDGGYDDSEEYEEDEDDEMNDL
ncbi:hypothetical protein CABS01_13997 [Colletotrichum abscissum]|uniref:uncharacterized protein n=1 Tax=Colletotrichum abscissum TaxID=1671311 RepID=UPI0027D58172|nr:uncharacterized protein CABS01_13997 [Colletotrichum abscissum]KAK1482299.1 hypothetical protein CABS01_13997 [Colletotrichum abscissum]